MLPMFVVKRKMGTIKQLGKGDNAHQRSLTFHSSLKKILKNAIKAFSSSTCIMIQSRYTLKRALMLKGMVSPLKVDTPN